MHTRSTPAWHRTLGAVALFAAMAAVVLANVALAAPGGVPKADVDVINLVNRKAKWQAQHDAVRPLILALGAEKEEAKRQGLEDRIVEEFGRPAIEVLVRYRESSLIPVFVRLTEAEDWTVRRLAVFGLQRTFGFEGLDQVVALLDDENPLVREIAATTLTILHHAAAKHKALIPKDKSVQRARKGLRKRKKADLLALEARLGVEENAYVRSAIQASIEVFGRRKLLRIHTEPVVEQAPGRFVPRLEGGQVNAHPKGSGVSSAGSGRLRPTSGWAYPVLLYPHEIFTTTSDKPLVPLPKKGNSFHYGHDCGWFLEGSGIYAIADGVVRWIRSGWDWGGLIAVEVEDEKGEKLVQLNGHCGMWVFVKGGESVHKGQLLGQMGLSFSAENGGHGAHDHFGMYRGAFSEGHCYGRSTTDRTKENWIVPAEFLTPRVEGKSIPPESYR